jgi:hypothetical protein
MNGDVDRPCPPWCQEPPGHLHPEADGPGDYHIAESPLMQLPEIPGLRGDTTAQVTIEQYVTRTATYEPVIAVCFGDEGEPSGNEALTLDEADALASALHRAVATVRAVPSGSAQETDGTE